jgi:hypothetical protein
MAERLWEDIRRARIDRTDYVAHLTRPAMGKSASEVLLDTGRQLEIGAGYAGAGRGSSACGGLAWPRHVFQ